MERLPASFPLACKTSCSSYEGKTYKPRCIFLRILGWSLMWTDLLANSVAFSALLPWRNSKLWCDTVDIGRSGRGGNNLTDPRQFWVGLSKIISYEFSSQINGCTIVWGVGVIPGQPSTTVTFRYPGKSKSRTSPKFRIWAGVCMLLYMRLGLCSLITHRFCLSEGKLSGSLQHVHTHLTYSWGGS